MEDGEADRYNTSKDLKAAPGSEGVFYSYFLICSRHRYCLNSQCKEKPRFCNLPCDGNVTAFIVHICLLLLVSYIVAQFCALPSVTPTKIQITSFFEEE